MELKELRASLLSLDWEFIPTTDTWIAFVPRQAPDVTEIVKAAEWIRTNPREDLESSYYRVCNWVHIRSASRLVAKIGISACLCGIFTDLSIRPSFLSVLLLIHALLYALVYRGSSTENPYLYYPHVIFNGFGALIYGLIALIFFMATIILLSSDATKNKTETMNEVHFYVSVGLELAVLGAFLYYSPLYAMARIGFGVYVIIVAVDLLHDPKQEVETAIGNQSPRVAMVVGALQMIGGLVEFYFVKVIYEDFKYFKTLLQSEDEKNAVV
ncbi:hypothetical protein M3Y94_00858400 [Aphelenchoides besseyi]|nr:hypothetical protein M3Y94_00858400 [Aphelenchoides besseyi]